MDFSGVIEGTCMSMCSDRERLMREREGLLHPLESVRRDDCQPDVNRRKSFGKSPSKMLMKADPDKIVKEYSRSAAGRCDLDPSNVRPASVLKRTMTYLLTQVAVIETSDWTGVYDFIFDRIRAVRQDMTIQGIVGRDAITILEQTVRFHAFASYKLRNSELSDFDPAINKHHLLECLKELLCFYQTTDGPHKNQPEFESVYLCDNLGHEAALAHCLSLPDRIRSHPLVRKCFEASVSVLGRNFARTLRLVHSVRCPTCLSVVSYHLDRIRVNYLQILSHGYSVKNCQFPLDKLSQLLYLSTPSSTTTTTTTTAATTTNNVASTATTFDLCTACHLVDWFITNESSKDHVTFNKTSFSQPTEKRPCPSLPVLDRLVRPAFLPSVLSHGLADRDGWGSSRTHGQGERSQPGSCVELNENNSCCEGGGEVEGGEGGGVGGEVGGVGGEVGGVGGEVGGVGGEVEGKLVDRFSSVRLMDGLRDGGMDGGGVGLGVRGGEGVGLGVRGGERVGLGVRGGEGVGLGVRGGEGVGLGVRGEGGGGGDGKREAGLGKNGRTGLRGGLEGGDFGLCGGAGVGGVSEVRVGGGRGRGWGRGKRRGESGEGKVGCKDGESVGGGGGRGRGRGRRMKERREDKGKD